MHVSGELIHVKHSLAYYADGGGMQRSTDVPLVEQAADRAVQLVDGPDQGMSASHAVTAGRGGGAPGHLRPWKDRRGDVTTRHHTESCPPSS